MSKKKLSDKDNNNFQFRMGKDELERFIEILHRAERRQPRASESDVARRLAGLDPDTDGLVTEEDVVFFRHGAEPDELDIFRRYLALGKNHRAAFRGVLDKIESVPVREDQRLEISLRLVDKKAS